MFDAVRKNEKQKGTKKKKELKLDSVLFIFSLSVHEFDKSLVLHVLLRLRRELYSTELSCFGSQAFSFVLFPVTLW